MNRPQRRALALAGMLAGMGTLHFAVPQPFDRIVPAELPGSQRMWTYASGVAELGCAALVAAPGTRRFGGLATALLFVAVFPGNVQMAVDYQGSSRPVAAKAVAWARLPMQYPLIAWALRVRETGR